LRSIDGVAMGQSAHNFRLAGSRKTADIDDNYLYLNKKHRWRHRRHGIVPDLTQLWIGKPRAFRSSTRGNDIPLAALLVLFQKFSSILPLS
jgi:hypothetical protein